MASRTVTVVLAGNSKGAERALGRTSKGMGKLARAAKLGGAAVVALGAALATKGVLNAVKFEKQLREVRTLLPKLSDEGFGQMQKDVLAFSDEMGTTTDKVIPALYAAISAGVPKENVFEFLRVANKASVGGVTDLETAVDGISSAVNAYGPEVLSAAQASDVLFTAVRLGKTNFGELSGSINQIAPLAAAMGIGFEDVAAAATQLTTTGVPTAEAMTKVRALLQSLVAPSVKAVKVFDDLGISVDAARIAEEGLLPVLKEIEEKTGGNVRMQKRLFGSVESLQAAMTIMGDGGEQYTDILTEMQNSTGATDKAFDVMAKGAAFKWQLLMTRLNNILTKFGLILLPVVTKAISFLADGIQSALPVVVAFAKRAWGTLSEVIQDVLPVLRGLGAFLKTNIFPILKIWGKLIFVLYKQYFKQLVKGVKRLASFVVENFKRMWEKIKPSIDKFKEALGIGKGDGGGGGGKSLAGVLNFLKETVSTVFAVILPIIEFAIGTIIDKITFFVNHMLAVIRFWKAIFTGDWSAAWDAVKDILSNAWEFIQNKIQRVIDLIVGVFDVFGVDIEKVWDDAWNAIKSGWNAFKDFFVITIPDGFRSMVNSIIGMLEMIPNTFIAGLNAVAKSWNAFHISIPGLGDVDTPDLPVVPRISLPRLGGGPEARAADEWAAHRRGYEAGGIAAFDAAGANAAHAVSAAFAALDAGARFTAIDRSVAALDDGGSSFFGDFARALEGFNLKIPGFASGGIVPATPGGRIIRVAEGGRPEAIVPLGRQGMRAPIEITLNNYGSIGTDSLMDELIKGINLAMERGEISLT